MSRNVLILLADNWYVEGCHVQTNLVAAAFLLFPVTGKADAVFVWRDAQGVINYSDTLPGEGARDVKIPGSKATVRWRWRHIRCWRRASGRGRRIDGWCGASTGGGISPGTSASSGATVAGGGTSSSTAPSSGTTPSSGSSGRDGSTGLRLRTERGDHNVAGSKHMERTDLWLSQSATGCYEGREQVWEHSILFPDDFAIPTWHMYVVFAFHQTARTGQANFHVNFENGVLIFRGYGGTQDSGLYKATIGPVKKNLWYDFVYHVKCSFGADGFFKGWVNGEQKLNHRGPTLYAGQGCYLKLANYHVPVCDPYPGCMGRASSVIHDRVIRHELQ